MYQWNKHIGVLFTFWSVISKETTTLVVDDILGECSVLTLIPNVPSRGGLFLLLPLETILKQAPFLSVCNQSQKMRKTAI